MSMFIINSPVRLVTLFFTAWLLLPSCGISQSTAFDSLNSLQRSGEVTRDSLARFVLTRVTLLDDAERDSVFAFFEGNLQGTNPKTACELALSYNRYNSGQPVIDFWKNAVAHIENYNPLDTLYLSRSWNYCGGALFAYGLHEQASDYFNKVIAIIPPDRIDEELAVAHNNLATVLNTNNDPGAALPNYIRARDIFIELLGEDHYYIGVIRNNIGQVYSQLGRYNEQIEEQEAALAILLDKMGPKHKLTGNAYQNLGIAYRNTGRYLESLEAFDEVIRIRKVSNDKAGMVRAISEKVSTIASDPANHESTVLEAQSEAISKAVALLDSNHTAMRNLYNNHALALMRNKEDYLSALYYLNKAIEVTYQGQNPPTDQLLPPVGRIPNPNFTDVRLFENRGYLLQRIYEQTSDTSFLFAARRTYALGDSIMEILRGQLITGLSRKNLIREAGDYYLNAATTAFSLFQYTGNRADLALTYSWIEKSRNWELISAYLQSTHNKILQNDTLITQLASIADQLGVSHLSDIQHAPDSLSLLVQARLNTLRQKYPGYFDYIYNVRPTPLDSILAFCSRENVSWLHFSSLTNGRTLSLLATPDTLLIESVPEGIERINALADSLEARIRTRNWDFADEAHKLCKLIFGSMLDHISTEDLYVSSAGLIDRIPLDVLLVSKPVETAPSAYTTYYLINRHTITLIPSGTLGLLLSAPKAPLEKPVFIAPEYDDNGLRYHREEILRAAQILGAKEVPLPVTKRAFADCVTTYDLLHFAGHSFANEHDLNSIFLLLGRGDDTLYLNELFNLQSEVELAVLSSCRSAAGRKSYEGTIGLSYGFMFAGTPSVISSLWLASDRESMSIFESFYHQMGNGVSSNKSLRLAKLNHLRDAPTPARHPYYWANWIHYGHGKSMGRQGDKKLLLIPVFAAVILLILLFRRFY